MSESGLEEYQTCPRLPTLPAIALQVLEMTRSDRVDLGEMAEVVQNDQALAGKVLRTVNSSYYGLSRPCSTVKQAMVYLGVNTVRTLVLGFSLIDCLDDESSSVAGFDYRSYWRHGLFTAVAAREIALLHQSCSPDHAFLGGLIGDIGMVVMHRVHGREYLDVLNEAGEDYRRLPALERAAFEVDHTEVGRCIANQWKLPAELVQCIRYHHSSDNAAVEFQRLAQTVELANAVAISLTLLQCADTLNWIATRASWWFNLNGQQTSSLLTITREASAELAGLFKTDPGSPPDVDQLLADAEAQLIDIHLQLEQENEALRQRNQHLEEQALLDPLTKIANRQCFDEELERCFAEHVKSCRPLAVLFGDIDEFKMINDTHGHQVGDAVLIEFARRLETTVGDRGLVARYGGEEFAVLFENTDRAAATRIAEELRNVVANSPVPINDMLATVRKLNLTISFGLAVLEPHLMDIITRPSLLLRIADQAVYAAKAAGRNCVRVYHNARRPAA